MPQLTKSFRLRVQEALDLARAGDLAASQDLGTPIRSEWYPARVEFLYELAFLRLFVEWEKYLEDTFLRYMCGYVSSLGAVTLRPGLNFATLQQARTALLAGRAYILWYDPQKIISRSHAFFDRGFHENVVASNSTRLNYMASIRHRVAHDQLDARTKFDMATINLAGKRYRGARPGRFLRDWDQSSNPQHRWLDTIGFELIGLANQIA